jgi:soluble lytic murein transglycosylase-like protein
MRGESLAATLARISEIQNKFYSIWSKVYPTTPSFSHRPSFSSVLKEKIEKSTPQKISYEREKPYYFPTKNTKFDSLINIYSKKYGVDPNLVKAVIKVESDFNPYCVSHKGACGLMQLMPSTAATLGVKNIFSPEENIEGGVAYLRQLLDKWGKLDLALAAYNAGSAAVEKANNSIPNYEETKNYVKKVLHYYYNGIE